MSVWIVDANIAASWVLKDELDRDYALAVLAGLHANTLLVPALWVTEVSNALVSAFRRKRMDEKTLGEAAALLAGLPIVIDPPSPGSVQSLPQLSLKYRLTGYDASYLELALRVGAPIATKDKELLIAMKLADVDLVQP